jgi:hypothetical protein
MSSIVHGFTLTFNAAMFEDFLKPHLKSPVVLSK